MWHLPAESTVGGSAPSLAAPRHTADRTRVFAVRRSAGPVESALPFVAAAQAWSRPPAGVILSWRPRDARRRLSGNGHAAASSLTLFEQEATHA